MTRDRSLFSFLSPKNGGFLSYDDNNKGKIIGFWYYCMFLKPTIGDVILVNGLKYNLSSMSQLCVKANNMTFDSSRCKVINSKTNQTFFTSLKNGNIYPDNFNKIPLRDVCILSNE